MTTSESKGRFFLQNESIRIDSHNKSNRIANWNALLLIQSSDLKGYVRYSSVLLAGKTTAKKHIKFVVLSCS